MKSSHVSRWKSLGRGLAMGALAGLLVAEMNLPGVFSLWGDMVPWVVGAAILGAAFWIGGWRKLWGTLTVCLGVLWLAVAFTPLCAWLYRDLPRRDTLESADAVYVLASDVQKDGELTSEATSRLLHALELLGQGLAPRLILSELPLPVPSYQEAAKKIMRHLGMTQEVLSVGPVENTRDEAVAVGALFRRRGWRKLLVVTSPNHSRRASAALGREGIEVVSSPSTQTDFDLETLDSSDDRLRAFVHLAHERLGWWFYERRGWITP